jgi:hypothetical protein
MNNQANSLFCHSQLTQRKRNQLNPITLPWENVQNVVGFWQGGCIELIPFAMSQASWETSLDYPNGAFWRQQISCYSDPIPLLVEPELNYFDEKNTYPMDLIT